MKAFLEMKSSRIKFMVLFCIVVFFELALIAYLIINHRMVLGYDSFEWFVNQWYFINGKVSYNEIPLWTPYMSHGMVTSYNYSLLGVFSNILMLFSGWIKNVNFLPLFYLGLFFDKFILLTGVWLLAKRYFKSPVTVFFVACTVLASTITLTQIMFNISLIYCLPLTLYLLHRFFDSWNWKWLFLAVFLISIGGIFMVYSIFLFPLIVFLYFLVVYCISPSKSLEGFKIRKADIIWVIGTGIILLFMVKIFLLERDPSLAILTGGRNPDGSIPLHVFLTYGGGTNLFKWWELFLGISPGIDNTIYLGLLAIPLIYIGATGKNNNRYPFLVGAIFFLLFSMSSPVTVMVYYCWPLMKYYRHIGLITPLIKLYLCFLAGFGFEELFDFDKNRGSKEIFYKSLFSGIFLLLNGLFLCLLVINTGLRSYFIHHISKSVGAAMVLPAGATDYLFYMALFSIGGALIFWARPSIKNPKFRSLYVLILILFHLTIIYSYAFQQIQQRTFPLSPKEYALMKFQKIPFVNRRFTNEDNSSRAKLVSSFMGGRAAYDGTYNFTFSDMVETGYRSYINLKPYDSLCHLFFNNGSLSPIFSKLDDTSKGKIQFAYPLKDEAAAIKEIGVFSPVFSKLVGYSEDKIQFFANAYPLKDVAAAIQDKRFSGDLLFYSAFGQSGLQGDQLKGLDLSRNQRLKIPYQILSFSPNQIVIGIDHLAQKGAWMQYCDIWHPQWKAEVNGRPQKVYIGNMAYKAIPLEQGKNIVRFYFESDFLKWVYYYFMIGSFIWMVLLICLLVGCLA